MSGDRRPVEETDESGAPASSNRCAQVVHAAFSSFAEGEAARHIPSAWETIPPEVSFAAWRRGSAAYVRRILGDEPADSPGLARAADLTHKPATGAPEHRGDGHVAALLGARVGGAETHVLSALVMGIHPPESFGRIHHLPEHRLAEVMHGLRGAGSSTPTAGSPTPAARPSSASRPSPTSSPPSRTTPCPPPSSNP